MAGLICRVYLRGAKSGRSVLQHTPNGGRINFQGGCARIHNAGDLPYLLRLPEAVIEFERFWLDWVPGWLGQVNASARPVAAEIRLPAGFRLDGSSVVEDEPEEPPVWEDADPEEQANVFADPGVADRAVEAGEEEEAGLTQPQMSGSAAPRRRDAQGHFIKE